MKTIPALHRLTGLLVRMGVGLLIAATVTRAQNFRFETGQRYVLPVQSLSPAIDGHIDPGEWAAAIQIDGFDHDQRRARGYVLGTREALYLAVRSQLPDRGDLVNKVREDNTDRLVHDDSVEMWIDLHPGATVGQNIQLITTPSGNQWWRIHGRGGMESIHTWQTACETRSGLHDGEWHCEIRVPLDMLGEQVDLSGRGLGINLWRNWKNPWKQAFMIGSVFSRAPTNVWVFTESPAPIVRFEERGDRFAGDVHLALVVCNPTGTPMHLAGSLVLSQVDRDETGETGVVELAPGATAEWVLRHKEEGRGQCRVVAEIQDARSGAVQFRHETIWAYEARVPWETPVQRDHHALQWRFRYSPSIHQLRVEADINNMPVDARVDRVRMVFREQESGREILTATLDDFVDGLQELTFPTPPDLEGVYELQAWAEGRNIPEEEIVDEIRRHRFDWEGNEIGMTNEVFPPFQPVRADGDAVSVVLRDYRMNTQGLWNSIQARGQKNNTEMMELLASPMRYRAFDANGRELDWTDGTLELLEQEPHVARYRAAARSAAVAVQAVSEIEMDGMMRVRLDLLPVEGAAALRRLSLEIPVNARHASLMHEVGDSLRRCYSGPVPSGEGVVWTSLETLHAQRWLNAFTTYVWLGGPERGVAWFAENDKGWLTAKDFEQPLMWVSREGDVVTLRVDLVNVPGVITEPTSLVFGLQASPTKPMPDDYRDKWHRYRRSGPVFPWGGMSCGWKQPWNNLWEVVDKVNESNLRPHGEAVDVNWFKAFEKKHDIPMRNGQPWSQRIVSDFASRIVPPDHGHEVYFDEMVVLMTFPEYHVFRDEWNRSRDQVRMFLDQQAMYTRYGNKYYNPSAPSTFSRSYQDYTLSLMNEWMKRGASIKWDNVFVKVSDDPWVSAAYRLPDGRIQPAAMTWNIRKYMRRTWNLLQTWRRKGAPRPLDFNPHMTNVLLLPWESWATMIDDLELSPNAYSSAFPQHYNPGFPFMPDFILAQTTGRQVGTHSTLVHNLFLAESFPAVTLGPAPEEVETQRREWGMRLVHEINFGSWQLTINVLGRLARAFGYGSDAVRVFNYWDDQPAFTTDHPDVRGILLSRPEDQASVLVLQSWHPDPIDVTVTLDPDVIGFVPGAHVQDVYRRRGVELRDGVLQAGLDFPFANAIYVFHQQEPSSGVVFHDDFTGGPNFAWDYIARDADLQDGVVRILENRTRHWGVPRLFNGLEFPDFKDGELSVDFSINEAPDRVQPVLNVVFPGEKIAWNLHGLSHSRVEGAAELDIAADPEKGFRYTLRLRNEEGNLSNAAQGYAGEMGTGIQQVCIRAGESRYQVEVNGTILLNVEDVLVPTGRAFQLSAARDPTVTGGLNLHAVTLRAGRVSHARLDAERADAARKSAEYLAAARRDPMREALLEVFDMPTTEALLLARFFNRPQDDARRIVAHLRSSDAAPREALLILLGELPGRQTAHVDFMRGIGQEPEQVPDFIEARAWVAEQLEAWGMSLPEAERQPLQTIIEHLKP